MIHHIVTVIAIVVFVFQSSAVASIKLVHNAQPQGIILIASDSPDSVRFAAQELQYHIEKMSGASLSIQIEDKATAKNELPVIVSLGETDFSAHYNVTAEGLAYDGFRIREAGGAMVIVGKDYYGPQLGDRNGNKKWTYNKYLKINAHGETGTQFGVYRFLRDQGIRWYMPGDIGLVVPKRSNVVFDGKEIEDAPHFTYRKLHGFSFDEDPDAAVWYKRVGYGSVRYLNLNHSFTDWGKRFENTHPEYFASVDGKSHLKTVNDKIRVFINYTEPAVLEQVVQDATKYFSKHPEESLIPVVPNDSHIGHDESAETLKYIKREKFSSGWLSDLVWGFVNKVAERVDGEYPGKEVGSLAYAYQFEAPSMIKKFAPNVVVMHCRQRRDFYDSAYKQHVWHNLHAYTKLGPSRQYIWEYYNLRSRHEKLQWVPFLMPRMIAADIHELKGISSGEFIQAKQSMKSNKLVNPAYYHLNLYVTARALWNPDLDIEALLDEYSRLFYGPAAKPMKLFWDRLEQIWMTQSKPTNLDKSMNPKKRNQQRKRRWVYYWSEVYTTEVVDELFEHLDKAAVLVKPNFIYSERVAFMRSQFLPMRKMARNRKNKGYS